jgi:hypothetical protein
MIKKVAVIVFVIVAALAVAGCTVGLPSKSSPTPTSPRTPSPTVTTPTPTEQTRILFFESDNAESAAMQPVIAQLMQKYDVTTYNLTANLGYTPMARNEYSVTETPTIVVLHASGPFESLNTVNIVGVHSYDEVLETIELGD